MGVIKMKKFRVGLILVFILALAVGCENEKNETYTQKNENDTQRKESHSEVETEIENNLDSILEYEIINTQLINELELNGAKYCAGSDNSTLIDVELNIHNISSDLLEVKGMYLVGLKNYDATIILDKGGLNINSSIELNPDEISHIHIYTELSNDEATRINSLILKSDDKTLEIPISVDSKIQ